MEDLSLLPEFVPVELLAAADALPPRPLCRPESADLASVCVALTTAIDGLPPPERDVFRLHRDGLSLFLIAARLSIPIVEVCQRYCDARRHLVELAKRQTAC